MRTRSRFVLLFASLGALVMIVGLAAIFRAVALDSARRLPIEAERILAEASALSLDESVDPAQRLRAAGEALGESRALLARNRIMLSDPVIGLAIQVAGILAAVLVVAALVFGLLSRVFTRGIDELVAGVLRAGSDKAWRFPASGDPELGRVRRAINELLDVAAEQERRLSAGALLEGWREVASFLAHQIKNPLAALGLAAENLRLTLDACPPSASSTAQAAVARESLAIVKEETARLAALIGRFRDLAPAGLEAYAGGRPLHLAELLEDCAVRARSAGAEVRVTGEGPVVVGERALLGQAFGNLFANSIEAAGGGKVSITALLSVEAADASEGEGGTALVTLRDSNTGLDPAILGRLGSERFTTKRGGTGLGLLLVRRVLALQGGSLALAAEAGGLVARVRLPLAGGKP